MNELKPCPFCGGKVNITYNSGHKLFFVWHKEKPCGISEPMSITQENAKSLNEAYMVWNERKGDI